jgi:NTP pyrophosphatase (non-canonical NTP hydrolase)
MGEALDALRRGYNAVTMPTTEQVGAWLAATFGPDRSPVEQGLVLAEETGEVCRALVKREQRVRGDTSWWTAHVRAEVADVVITCLSLAATERFDLAEAVAERWAHVSRRDSVGHRPPD